MMLLRFYDRCVIWLAAAGAASLGVITLLIIYDVISRNFGLMPLRATSALVEYALLFSTMAAAPWLVRINGHVSLSSVVGLAPPAVQRAAGQLVVCIAAVAVAILAFVSAEIAVQQWQSGAVDMRSVDLPNWLLYACLAVGFGLMATEFLRLLLRGEAYTGAGGEH